MGKTALTAAVFTALMAVSANAQNGAGNVAPELGKPTPGQLLNQDYLTSTGETVPRPGVPQASGPTPLDRSLRQQDNRIDKSICANC
jgi:hypothetical protein